MTRRWPCTTREPRASGIGSRFWGEGVLRAASNTPDRNSRRTPADTVRPRWEFMGRVFKYIYYFIPFACASGLLQATGSGNVHTGANAGE